MPICKGLTIKPIGVGVGIGIVIEKKQRKKSGLEKVTDLKADPDTDADPDEFWLRLWLRWGISGVSFFEIRCNIPLLMCSAEGRFVYFGRNRGMIRP